MSTVLVDVVLIGRAGDTPANDLLGHSAKITRYMFLSLWQRAGDGVSIVATRRESAVTWSCRWHL